MRLLIIGSLNNYIASAARIAFKKGAQVSQVKTPEEALKELRGRKSADLILMDATLDIKGFIMNLKKERFSISIISCGIDVSPKQAAQSIRDGAKDYISLPPDPEFITSLLNVVTKDNINIIHKDSKMSEILKIVDRIAPTEANILITGESGTGKEVVAQYIHKNSKRSNNPFISVNCAAIPENLLESELFGHEKGAFTGAIAQRIGKFEEADGGTLLLDEISEMHPRLQAKLLRAVQERVIDRIGGTNVIRVDIRILATSNRDLLKSVENNEFREDLYFRLNVVNVHLPLLRERIEDIIPLAEHFTEKYCNINHLSQKMLSKTAKEALLENLWRGNVRELDNTIHRAVLLAQNDILTDRDIKSSLGCEKNLPTKDQVQKFNQFVGKTISDVEKELILKTLDHCFGNRTHAANILGISIRTLRNKLKEYEHINIHSSSGVMKG
ncbi:MAG: sigma-54-dependent transcriptional regulator [Alphaproteobacteria bacterium]